jgi:hypothetical protein
MMRSKTQFATIRPATVPGAGVLVLAFGVLFGCGLPYGNEVERPLVISALPEEPPAPEVRDAWALLTDGRYADARAAFVRHIEEDPAPGRPYVGYALAVAGEGDLPQGARGMRGVLATAPDALSRLEVDDRLDDVLDKLILAYHQRLRRRGLDADTLLMVGVLYYLQGELDPARHAETLAGRLAERSPAVANLGTLIDEAEDQPVPQVAAREFEGPARGDVVRASATPSAAGNAASVPSDRTPDPPRPAVTPAAPTEPVDYDALRRDLLGVSETLDRFTRKLLGKLGAQPGSELE